MSFGVSSIPELIGWDHRLMNKVNVMVKLYEKFLHKGSLEIPCMFYAQQF
jgi:hypothetical protein